MSDTARNVVRVTTPPSATTTPLEMGDDDGVEQRIQLSSRYVTVDGEPWIPVMGEYHFSRDLPHRWETELRKMTSGGISVVATYMIWNIHEDVEGEIRWDGHRDVRRFVELADKVGLKVMLRIGPWAHGESRNGGFPDWLQAKPMRHRSDDPAYLAYARRWYAAIEEQVRGLFHTAENPAAPIIGIQVDNELYDNGPHLATLRKLAEDVGMTASLWTATGWGGAELPYGRVLPVYAGYSDGFWEESTTGWPAFGVMHFTYNTVRDDLTVGADVRDAPADIDEDANLGAGDPWPFVTCELGGGMAVAYHRRPLVDSDDVAALALTKVGSGSSWQGYYMYHGGLQVKGLQESHDTGYPNDVPVRDYDFHAPLGTVGSQRRHYHLLRQQHLMLSSFGSALAGAVTTIPERQEGSPRWAVRSDGTRGFLFANNHQPAIAALPAVDGVQFTVDFDDASVTIPSIPATLESGAYFAWPLRQKLGSLKAVSVTAQPITEFEGPGGPVVLFAATTGIDVEIQIEGATGDIAGATVVSSEGALVLRPDVEPGLACEVRVGDTTLVFLDQPTAESVWRGDIAGRDSVVLWRGEGWFGEHGFEAVLGSAEQELDVFPPLEGAERVSGEGSVFARYAAPAAPAEHALEVPAFGSAPVAPVHRAGSSGRLSAPVDFSGAASVEVPVPADALTAERAILSLDWTGDVIRAYVGDEVIVDQYWYGRTLEIDLAPYASTLAETPLILRAFAWDPATEVYVDERVRPQGEAPVLAVRSAIVRPVATAQFA